MFTGRGLVGRFSIYIILTGILLVLFSAVPVAHTLYRMAVVEPVVIDVSGSGEVQHKLMVAGTDEIMLVLSASFAAGSGPPYRARYSYEITTPAKILQHSSGVIVGDGSGPVELGSRGESAQVEQRMPLLQLAPSPQELTIRVRIDPPAEHKGAVLVGAWAQVFRDPPRFRMSFVSAMVVWTIGILLALIGTIRWGRTIAAIAVHPDPENERIRLWCTLCHLGALAGYVVPFGHIVAPLMIWMTTRGRVPGVDQAGRESINFQLTVTLFALVGVMLSVVFVGLIMLFGLVVLHVSMTLYAALRTRRGDEFSYPLNLRMIKPDGAGGVE